MDRSVQLLLLTMFLWILYTAAPTLDKYSPILEIGSSFQVTLAQVFNLLVVGVATYISSFAWLQSVLHWQSCPVWVSVSFLFFSYYIWAGHGIHAACVVAEGMKDKDHAVFDLLDFLHEKISHNMFVGGYYGIIMVIMCAEFSATVKWLKALKEEEKLEKINVELTNRVSRFVFNWFFPLIIGAYFSIFATRTGTVLVTVLFYLCVILLVVVTGTRLSSMCLTWSHLFQHSRVFVTFMNASFCGVIVLALLVFFESYTF